MRISQHTIFSKIKDSSNFFILNPLSGNADILNENEAGFFEAFKKGEKIEEDFYRQLVQKGYVMDEIEEKRLYRSKYLDFLDQRESDEVQLFFVPNYSCNFACSYCYQDEYAPSTGKLTSDIIDALFMYVTKEFSNRKKYITIFGGEPLLDSPAQKELIRYFIKKANEYNLELCFVTNGYTLANYMDILKHGNIREIQITLDGTQDIHDKRRLLKGGQKTFDQIVKSIDVCLENNMMVNLRMVVDKENIENIPELARFAIDKNWTKSPYFKTQLGRNYELHHCQSAPQKLFSRISLYENLYEIIKENPHILEFYKPAYSITKFLAENGSMPDALFDSCPACKTEWAFDYTGKIYSCTATVGKSDESLGSFYPEISLQTPVIKEWERRDVMSIPECVSCNVQLACGGGCGSVAKNKTGKICSTDCRPIKELLELGMAAYF